MEGPRGMFSTIDYISEVGRTFAFSTKQQLTSVRFSSVSGEVQYNHAVWTILGQLQQELTLVNPTYSMASERVSEDAYMFSRLSLKIRRALNTPCMRPKKGYSFQNLV